MTESSALRRRDIGFENAPVPRRRIGHIGPRKQRDGFSAMLPDAGGAVKGRPRRLRSVTLASDCAVIQAGHMTASSRPTPVGSAARRHSGPFMAKSATVAVHGKVAEARAALGRCVPERQPLQAQTFSAILEPHDSARERALALHGTTKQRHAMMRLMKAKKDDGLVLS